MQNPQGEVPQTGRIPNRVDREDSVALAFSGRRA